jgi:myo-inositol-1(or 4)-monophosphatase
MVAAEMKSLDSKAALSCAVTAARAAGKLMRENLHRVKKINEATRHDIKLELDVRCQKLIERILRRAFPTIPILGEEGIVGDPEAATRWVVDPIDGTVNFSYGIPHACVSIALQMGVPSSGPSPRRSGLGRAGAFRVSGSTRDTGAGSAFHSVVGVVYDPFTDELWTAIRGGRALLNGRAISVSKRTQLKESIVALGFAKQRFTMNRMLPTFDGLIHRVRKVRIMGSAALALVYVASGRMDAYVEYGLRLWDIAAGGLIIESAGGEFWNEPVKGEYAYRILANNGRLRSTLERLAKK